MEESTFLLSYQDDLFKNQKEIFYYGDSTEEKYYEYSQLHRDNEPAWVFYRLDGSIKEKKYYKEGKLNNEKAPAIVKYYPNNTVELEGYYTEGKIHRKGGPAIIHYFQNGAVEYEIYYKNGDVYREGDESKPCSICYFHDGKIKREKYNINSRYNPDKEATYGKEYYLNGKIKSETYSLDYTIHNSYGPAYVEYSKEGVITKAQYYLFGSRIKESKYYSVLYILKKICRKIKKKLRNKLTNIILDNTILYKDVASLISKYVY